jgi:hypothetical protein
MDQLQLGLLSIQEHTPQNSDDSKSKMKNSPLAFFDRIKKREEDERITSARKNSVFTIHHSNFAPS